MRGARGRAVAPPFAAKPFEEKLLALGVLGVSAVRGLSKGWWHIHLETRNGAEPDLQAVIAQLQGGVRKHSQLSLKILKKS